MLRPDHQNFALVGYMDTARLHPFWCAPCVHGWPMPSLSSWRPLALTPRRSLSCLGAFGCDSAEPIRLIIESHGLPAYRTVQNTESRADPVLIHKMSYAYLRMPGLALSSSAAASALRKGVFVNVIQLMGPESYVKQRMYV